MKTALTSFAVIAACVLGAEGAAAADVASTRSDFKMNFHYSNAELATPEGQQALLSRLESKIRRECVPASKRTALDSPESRACMDKAMRTAIGKFNSESLASLYTSRTAG